MKQLRDPYNEIGLQLGLSSNFEALNKQNLNGQKPLQHEAKLQGKDVKPILTIFQFLEV